MELRQIIIILFVAIWLMVVLFALSYLGPWYRAWRNGAPIPVPRIIMMRLQQLDIAPIVDEYIHARKAGVDVNLEEIVALWRTSPRTFRADVQTLIAARRPAPK